MRSFSRCVAAFVIVSLAPLAACGDDDGDRATDAGPIALDAPASMDASLDGSPTDASVDATASDDAPAASDAGPVACGSETCGADEVCVHPCCGGAPPLCVEPDDAGVCPPGTTPGPCGARPGGGCTSSCTPPPPFCAPLPAACGGRRSCDCLRDVPMTVCPSRGGRCNDFMMPASVDCLCG